MVVQSWGYWFPRPQKKPPPLSQAWGPIEHRLELNVSVKDR